MQACKRVASRAGASPAPTIHERDAHPFRGRTGGSRAGASPAPTIHERDAHPYRGGAGLAFASRTLMGRKRIVLLLSVCSCLLLLCGLFLSTKSVLADGGAPNLAYIAGSASGISVVDIQLQTV